jgi:hypothetical protein
MIDRSLPAICDPCAGLDTIYLSPIFWGILAIALWFARLGGDRFWVIN